MRIVSDEILAFVRERQPFTENGVGALERLLLYPDPDIRNGAKLAAAKLAKETGDRGHQLRLHESLKQSGFGHSSPLEVCCGLDRVHAAAREKGEPPPDVRLRFATAVRRLLGQVQLVTREEIPAIVEQVNRLGSHALASCDALADDPAVDGKLVASLLYHGTRPRNEWTSTAMASEIGEEVRARLEKRAIRQPFPPRWALITAVAVLVFFIAGWAVISASASVEPQAPTIEPSPAPSLDTPAVLATEPEVKFPAVSLTKVVPIGVDELPMPAQGQFYRTWYQLVQATTAAKKQPPAPAPPSTVVPLLKYPGTLASKKLTAEYLIAPGGEQLLGALAERNLFGGATHAVVVRPGSAQEPGICVAIYTLPAPVAVDPKKPATRYWFNHNAAVEIYRANWRLTTVPSGTQTDLRARYEGQLRAVGVAPAEDATLLAEAAIARRDVTTEERVLAACVYLRAAKSGDAALRKRALEILHQGYQKELKLGVCRFLIAAESPENRKQLFDQIKRQQEDLLTDADDQLRHFLLPSPSADQVKLQEQLLQTWVEDELVGRGLAMRK